MLSGDRGQRTEVRGRNSEDRLLRSEFGMRKSEDRIRVSGVRFQLSAMPLAAGGGQFDQQQKNQN